MSRRDLIIGLVVLALAIGFPFADPPRFVLAQTIMLFLWGSGWTATTAARDAPPAT